MYIVGLLLVIAAYGVLFLLWRMLPPLTAQNHWYLLLAASAFGVYLIGYFSHQSTLICERGSDECSLVHSYYLKAEEKSEWVFSEIVSINIDKSPYDEPEERTYCPFVKLRDGQWILLRERYSADFHAQQQLVDRFNAFLGDSSQQRFVDERADYGFVAAGALLQLLACFCFVFPPGIRRRQPEP